MSKIFIEKKESDDIQKLHYEYHASLNILSYLLKQENINEDYLNQYFKKSEEYNISLNYYISQIIKKYEIKLNTKIYNYEFDFDNYRLIYNFKEIEGNNHA